MITVVISRRSVCESDLTCVQSNAWHDSCIINMFSTIKCVTWLIYNWCVYMISRYMFIWSHVCSSHITPTNHAGVYAWYRTHSSRLTAVSQSVSHVCGQSPPAPMNHVKYLRAGPAEIPFQNWYTANTNHFRLTDSVRWKFKTQLGWVINPVPHNLVRRVRFWRIKIPGTWFYIFVLDNK